jgi:hypothetical protein
MDVDYVPVHEKGPPALLGQVDMFAGGCGGLIV